MLFTLRASAVRPLRPALALLLLIVLTACAPAVSTTPVATNEVDLPPSYRFVPAAITVATGSTVTWTNNDHFTHSVLFDGESNPLMMSPGQAVTRTFDTPGHFAYLCSLHPNDMSGTVFVEPSS